MLAKRARSGALWAYGAFGAERVGNLVVSIVLARLVAPEQFGLLATALLILSFAEALRDVGLRDALTFSPLPLEQTAPTAFWMALASGALQAVAVLLASWVLHHTGSDPTLVAILATLALQPVLASLTTVQEAILQRELQYRSLYGFDLAAVAIKTALALGGALLGFGVWSLVVGQIASATMRMLGRWIMSSWRPSLSWDATVARDLFSYGRHLVLVNLQSIALERVDQILIAGALGPTALGYYFLATRICEALIHNVLVVLSRVTFPLFASVTRAGGSVHDVLLRTMRLTSMVTLPMGAGLALSSHEALGTLLGAEWLPAADTLSLLAVAGMLSGFAWSAGDAFKAVGRPDLVTKMIAFEVVLTLPLMAGLTLWFREPWAVAAALVAAQAIDATVRLVVTARFFRLKVTQLVACFRAPALATAGMSLAITAWHALDGDMSSAVELPGTLVIGVVTYAGMLWLLAADDLHAVVALLRNRDPAPGEAPASPPASSLSGAAT